MGPRRGRRGRLYLDDATHADVWALQWGRGADAADGRRRPVSRPTIVPLQWGRGADAADGYGARPHPGGHDAASMGPRRGRRGRSDSQEPRWERHSRRECEHLPSTTCPWSLEVGASGKEPRAERLRECERRAGFARSQGCSHPSDDEDTLAGLPPNDAEGRHTRGTGGDRAEVDHGQGIFGVVEGIVQAG